MSIVWTMQFSLNTYIRFALLEGYWLLKLPLAFICVHISPEVSETFSFLSGSIFWIAQMKQTNM